MHCIFSLSAGTVVPVRACALLDIIYLTVVAVYDENSNIMDLDMGFECINRTVLCVIFISRVRLLVESEFLAFFIIKT